MCQKQILVTLALVCQLCCLHFTSAHPPTMRPDEIPTDETPECPEIVGDCEVVVAWTVYGDCERCALLEGDSCHILEGICGAGLSCLPTTYDGDDYACAPTFPAFEGLLDNLTISEYEKWFEVLALAEHDHTILDRYVEEQHRRLAAEKMAANTTTAEEDSEKYQQKPKKNFNKNKLPKQYENHDSPCFAHADYVNSLEDRDVEEWRPVCDNNGFYSTTSLQCTGDEFCWCVNEKGVNQSTKKYRSKPGRCHPNHYKKN